MTWMLAAILVMLCIVNAAYCVALLKDEGGLYGVGIPPCPPPPPAKKR